jgi:hypothetical protein
VAGYSSTPLAKKLGIKEGSRIGLVNAPRGFRSELGELPENVEFVARLTNSLDIILFFVLTQRELARDFSKLAKKLVSNGMIWIAWPKKSSGVTTDLAFESVQRIGLDAGLVDVKICAVDDLVRTKVCLSPQGSTYAEEEMKSYPQILRKSLWKSHLIVLQRCYNRTLRTLCTRERRTQKAFSMNVLSLITHPHHPYHSWMVQVSLIRNDHPIFCTPY